MSSIVEPRTGPASAEGGHAFVIRGLGWKAYDAMAEALADRRRPRMTYARGDLELMSPSPEHEVLGGYLREVVRVAAEHFGVAIKGLGQTTFRSPILDRGLEPDGCFYTANWRRVAGKKRIDLAVDPAPDLAIEVDITASSLDRLEIYAALRVPEIWHCDGEALRILRLQPAGGYLDSEASPTFPRLPVGRVLDFIEEHADLDDVAWRHALHAWLREQAPPLDDDA